MPTLEVELLGGVYRASLPEGSRAEWPPHPERLFSALVQAWADGGAHPGERNALEWLERQPQPVIEADDAAGERDAPIYYVPPNDAKKEDQLPELRKRQARTFRAAVPERPFVHFTWPVEPAPKIGVALDLLARRVASIGHSTSLVRCAWLDSHAVESSRAWIPGEDGTALRTPYPGRLMDLETWHAENRRPLTRSRARYQHPTEGTPGAPQRSVFGGPDHWFIFKRPEGVADQIDVLALAHVAGRARAAIMSLGPQPSPEVLSGHASDGSPSQAPHLAVVPLLEVGWQHAEGRMLGLAFVAPRAADRNSIVAVHEALYRFANLGASDEAAGRAELRLTSSLSWHLQRDAAPALASLQPTRYCARARRWASVTPVVLDRHPREDDPIEAAEIVASACRHIGLPTPTTIELHKHSAFRGAPSAYPARGVPHRPDWSFPRTSKLASKVRRHVVIEFDDDVIGPVALGAGRYQGFGLCLPLRSEPER